MINKYDETMLATAKLFSELSYCVKAKVGAVIARDGRILATGYNGTVSGHDNCCEIEIKYTEYFCQYCNSHSEDTLTCLNCGRTRDPSSLPFIRKKLKTSPFTIHAEQNVISYCAKNGISTDGATMYITLSPCLLCAKLIVQAGIKRVVFLDLYKDTSGLKFLEDCNIKILKWSTK